MVKETGSPKLLFENLDLTPIHTILWKDLHTEGPGRPVEYKPEWDLKALMLRQLLQIPYMKEHLRFERVQEFHTDDMLKRAIQNMKKAKEP
jgi:hypothetical protein